MYKLTALLVVSYTQVAYSALRGEKGIQSNVRPTRTTSRTSRNEHSDHRSLQQFTVTGSCSVNDFAAAVGGRSALATLLGVSNDDTVMQQVLDTKCTSALEPQM